MSPGKRRRHTKKKFFFSDEGWVATSAHPPGTGGVGEKGVLEKQICAIHRAKFTHHRRGIAPSALVYETVPRARARSP